MVIDQGCLSYNISDAVFFYRATPDLNYRICSQEYWDFSTGRDVKRIEDGEADDSSDEDVTERVKVRKKYPASASSQTYESDEDEEGMEAPRDYGHHYKQLRKFRNRYV
jgi:hypothetical protein